jgi:hypothetical protein
MTAPGSRGMCDSRSGAINERFSRIQLDKHDVNIQNNINNYHPMNVILFF